VAKEKKFYEIDTRNQERKLRKISTKPTVIHSDGMGKGGGFDCYPLEQHFHEHHQTGAML
jgi:hypothetical protein